MNRWRSQSLTALVILAMVAPPAHAHDEPIHQAMTDYAYEVLLAGGLFSDGQLPDGAVRVRGLLQSLVTRRPELRPFLRDMAKAVPKLRALRSELVEETTSGGGKKPCPPWGAFAGAPADWQLPPGGTLPQTELGKLRFPVSTAYNHNNLWCGIDETWTPSGMLATVNVVGPPGNVSGASGHADHTGVTLGYWAAAPDFELGDWRMRSTTLETLQNPLVASGIGLGTAGLVTVICFLACSFLPILCGACPVLGGAAGAAAVDAIMSLDAEAMEHSDFVGLGHHIDVKPLSPAANLFDDKRGKYALGAGPAGVPDMLELLVVALFDVMGWHVNHEASQAPKNYEIILGTSGGLGTDRHRNSIDRSPAEWETQTAIYLQLTPLDNLGLFGWEASKGTTLAATKTSRLGWPLHALGDATSPMHAVGTTGHGHRPYEYAVALKYGELVGSENPGRSLETIAQVVERAFEWRTFILNWRAQNNLPKEVPVRDLVTALAERTRQKAMATPSVWKPNASLEYFFGSKDKAKAPYDNPTQDALQRDTVIEGIAATLAFLVSTAEVLP